MSAISHYIMGVVPVMI